MRDFNTDVGLKIFNARKNLKMSRAELGKKINLHESTIKRYEDGHIKSLDIEKLKEFASALDISPVYLMGWKKEKEELKETKHYKITREEQNILNSFNKLNIKGKNEAIKRVNELAELPKYQKDSNITELPKREKQIWEEPGKEYLMPIASHDKEVKFTEEEYKHDDELMNNEDIWK